MTKEEFSVVAPSIPHSPGVYKYYDGQGELLYIGKAKDLRKRVSSYFNKSQANRKTVVMVAHIRNIEYTVTETEHDAFLLENSLIKHHQPRYNIELKDDKTYPYIVIKNERFPRVFFTRTVIRDGSEYLGPFTSVFAARELLDTIRQNIPLRNCTLNLSRQNIERGKFKVCLEYHLGNCKGPCEGLQSEEDYNEKLQYIRHILKGNVGIVLRELKAEMQDLAAKMQFEQAEILRQKIVALERYQSNSTVVNPKLKNVDVISILSDAKTAVVNFMMLQNGTIISANTVRIEKKIEEEEESDMLSLAYAHFRERFNSIAQELIAPMEMDLPEDSMKLTIPKAGDKLKLLEMSLKNATVFRDDLRRKSALMLEETAKVQHDRALTELQEALHLPALPVHIECFDNSNFQGSFPVAAMVCFRNGQPAKQDYRHFKIKTVQGIDDFASMSEIVFRRYKRLKEEGVTLPQLVIIDGGKGQLGAALKSIRELELEGKMTIVGLAKQEESIFFPGDKTPLQLPYDSPAHLLVRRIRDEVHRFGITFHRNLRSKGTIKNELEEIPGIGEKTATELLQEFKSVNKIRTLTERELTRVIGASKAAIVWRYFNG
ncbi:excinuclease ABC subunit UvrC [Rurimicrobium arvi]|uniref:UvrABC system protein C n=1 Tax=Rurimicrobium arvi TaxID=2049916 RepID=A0ABP8MLJ0_9BACT